MYKYDGKVNKLLMALYINGTIQGYTTLHNVIQDYTTLYIRLHSVIQDYTALCKTIKIMTLHKIVHDTILHYRRL
jgi:hypothetical protein